MQELPQSLKDLVHASVEVLGVAIKEEFGDKFYLKVERTRQGLKGLRDLPSEKKMEHFNRLLKDLSKCSPKELTQLNRSFALMLELINTCESVYRCQSMGDSEIPQFESKPKGMIFVFTAHPTEARTQEVLEYFKHIHKLLLKQGMQAQGQLKYYLRILLGIPLANHGRPQVVDEARNIFGHVLNKPIIDEQIHLHRKGVEVYFRTWVGGDKDGHPLVNEKTMRESLQESRLKLLQWALSKIDNLKDDWEIAGLKTFYQSLVTIEKELNSIRKIRKKDGIKIAKIRKTLFSLEKKVQKRFDGTPVNLKDLTDLFWLYPALVMPLEIREESDLVIQAHEKTSMAIVKMLKFLNDVSEGYDAKWYARGFILSMCETSEGLISAFKLAKKYLKHSMIPVVPLFENEKGLSNGVSILQGAYEYSGFLKDHRKKWNQRFEVMVGYSDSSKENGLLPGKLLISNALKKIDEYIYSQKLTPVFFHGSGGSVARGGGSIKEQTQWMPNSALSIYKATIQGEMVARQFSQDKIVRSQILKLLDQWQVQKNSNQSKYEQSKVVSVFSEKIKDSYRFLIQDELFIKLVEEATPYNYLSELRIGSRPSKRAASKDRSFSLRAIPWILCWTQTRLFLPNWWGVGSSFASLSLEDQQKLKKDYQHSALLQSYVKALGFTFEKMDMSIWRTYLNHSKLAQNDKNVIDERIQTELELTKKFFAFMTENKEWLWFRPWLSESIYYRSSFIHLLNMIQLEALRRKNYQLLRETVTGISCGMLTTG